MHLLFLSMSAHLTKELGMAPGGEFRTAFREVSMKMYCIYPNFPTKYITESCCTVDRESDCRSRGPKTKVEIDYEIISGDD